MNIPAGPYLKDELYRQRLVLYIDILGFTKAVNRSSADPQYAEHLIQILESLVAQNTTVNESDESGWLLHFGYRGVRRISMSDCILVSLDTQFQLIDLRKQGIFSKGFQIAEFEDMQYGSAYLKHIALSSILRDCARIQIGLLEAGFLSRGAITVGPIRQHKGIVLGPAYNEAVILEKQLKLPAAILSKNVIDEYFTTWSSLLTERERIKHRLKTSQNPFDCMDLSAAAIWAVAPESEKWINEIQPCINCIVQQDATNHIFNYVKFANIEYLWEDKISVLNFVKSQINTLEDDKTSQSKWTWLCQELEK